MGQLNRAALVALKDEIKNETSDGLNTATRIGQILEDLIDSQLNILDDNQPLGFTEVDYTTAWNDGTVGNPGYEVDLSSWDKTKPLFLYIEYHHATIAKDSEFWMEILNSTTGVGLYDKFVMKVDLGETFTKIWRIDGAIQGDATVVGFNPNFEEELQKVTLYQWA